MRVNITYGVELEEVPNLVESLTNEALVDLSLALGKLAQSASSFSDLNPEDYSKLVHEARLLMSKVDLTLTDVSNLGTGYLQAIKAKQAEEDDYSEDPELKGPDVPQKEEEVSDDQKRFDPRYKDVTDGKPKYRLSSEPKSERDLELKV